MNQSNERQDAGAADLDARLARLPQWQPPADFAVRLAAAAARQRYEAYAAPDTRAWVWRRFLAYLPMGLATGATVLVLACLPWTKFAADPLFTWIIAGGAGATGIALTLRLLRSR